MTSDRAPVSHVWILLAILLVGTGFRLAVLSHVKYVPSSGYSSFMKSTLNYVSSSGEIEASEGEWRDGGELFNKLFVIQENGINYSRLFQELMQSNHPPLYYYILHTAIAISAGKTATPGIGYMINFPLFWIQVLVLYSLCSVLFSSRIVPLFAAFLSAVGFLSMDAFLLHKGYQLQVTLILLAFFLVFSFFQKDVLQFTHYLLYGIICLLAFFTHYYSYLYIFGIALIILLQYTLLRKDFRRLAFMGVSTILAAMAAFIIYPPSIRDVLMDYRSLEIQQKLLSAVSVLVYKMKVALLIFRHHFLATPYLLTIACIVALIIISALTRQKGFTPRDLFRNSLYLYLAGYFFIIFFMNIYISPYNNIRYVVPLIPLFVIILAGMLEVLPGTVQARSALLISVFFITFNIYGIAKVIQGELPGSALISTWRSQSALAEFSENAGVIIVSSQPKEKIRPVLYHAAPRDIAFCANQIPEDLFGRESEILVFLDIRLSREVRRDNSENLEKHGFQRSDSFRGFAVFKRVSTRMITK
jgi:hypothetical protein